MTDNDLSRFPAGTILAEMVIDIFADKGTGEITILHDSPFVDTLLGIQMAHSAGDMLFIFANHGARPFGMKLSPPLTDMISKAKEITLIQINKQTNKPVFGMKVPLEITNLAPAKTNEKDPGGDPPKELRGKFKRKTDN
jgi:hypothetical protein